MNKELKLEDEVTLVFKNDKGESTTLDVSVKQLLDKTSDDFSEMLEDGCEGSASCHEFCECEPRYDDYAITNIEFQSCGLLPSELLAENRSIKDEREVLIKAFSDVTKEFTGRGWITDGRGPYAYDDDEYRKEVSYLFDAFEKIKSEMWSNIQSKTFEYKNQIEEPLLKQRDEALEMLKRAKEAIKTGDIILLDYSFEEITKLIESTNP